MIGRRLGFTDLAAITLGSRIYIRNGCETPALLAHELRHVAQYELAGSLKQYLRLYVEDLITHGYERAPLEIDARAAEALAR